MFCFLLDSKKLSGEVVLVGSSLNTVESLRGRLLTERQASRVANEEAELLENKLKELERKLKEETKLRGKAEKKLRFLMKKLHSLTFTLDPSQELPSSSDSSGLTGLFSSTASSSVTTSSSSANNNTEDAESQFQNKIPDIDSASAPISQSAKTSYDDDDDAQRH
ncbi:hypothetical protein LINPERHAP1_LOCUS13385 [Linum perenne]